MNNYSYILACLKVLSVEDMVTVKNDSLHEIEKLLKGLNVNYIKKEVSENSTNIILIPIKLER